ncbi:hypothetical protein DFH94DRAFT_699535 [Russula ochroleuca]|uniref:Uncharacterized protein n=1 Tax=Russula ochroleuca TaxID=152965 RepID=A0A9P5JUK9_9AGAM|nr:hypothetical protein DFH94DRAFT_699535 [Russula ochroleuca]
MANNVSLNHAPDAGFIEESAGGVVNVDGPLIGRSLIDSIRRKISPSVLVQDGDLIMDRSRDLLRRHFQLMEVRDQDEIRDNFDDLRDRKNGLENFSGSRFQKLREANKYRRLAKIAYRIVKVALWIRLRRPYNMEMVLAQVSSLALFWSGPGSQFQGSVASIPRNLFTDSHAISTLSDVAVIDVDRVEMSTYQAGDTGEAAVVLDVIARDESVQHIVASFPAVLFSGVRTERGAPETPAALSLHQEDGTMPRFIMASLPDLSQDQGETRSLRSLNTLTSITSSEVFGTSEGSSFYPEPRP